MPSLIAILLSEGLNFRADHTGLIFQYGKITYCVMILPDQIKVATFDIDRNAHANSTYPSFEAFIECLPPNNHNDQTPKPTKSES